MDLLHTQFNHGHLSLEEIKTVLGTDFGQAWPTLQKKFKTDESGLFFNERLDVEREKRMKFIKHQSENGRKGGRPQNPRVKPNETHGLSHGKPTGLPKQKPLENENRNENTEDGTEGDFIPDGIVPDMVSVFRRTFPNYFHDQEIDFPACMAIAKKIAAQNGWKQSSVTGDNRERIRKKWIEIVDFVYSDKWFKTRSISDLNNEWQRLIQAFTQPKEKAVLPAVASAPELKKI